MPDYILEEEEKLSPVVVVTTVVLTAAFLVGILYQVALAVL